MMTRWALKSLFSQPVALIGSALAVAAAFLLVMLFEAVWEGETEQVVAYPRHAGADVWVMQDGVSNMHMASSLIDDGKRHAVADVEGVAEVTAILYMNTLVGLGGQDWFSYVVGLPPGAERGGPWAMAAGSARPAPGEAVVPQTMARLSGAGIGEEVRIADVTLRVAGLSRDTFSMANPVTFVHVDDLREILSAHGYDSYLLVRAAPGAQPAALAAAIEQQVSDVEALARETFIRNDRRMATQMGVELIGLMTGISAALAVLLVAFTLYTHVLRHRRELAILKALGFHRRHLYATALLQAAVLSALGFAFAVGLAYGTVALAAAGLPQVSMHLTGGILLRVGLSGAAVGLLATLIPVRQIAVVDPQTVFQS